MCLRFRSLILIPLITCLTFLSTNILANNDSGEQLYQQHCSACHGSNGSGGVGVPLALPDFQASVSDDYLRETIRLGRPGRIMPPFPSLTDDQIDRVIGYIRQWSTKQVTVYQKDRVTGNAAHGGELYQLYCAACHGDHGEGGAGTGVTFSRPRDLPIIAPALNNSGFLKAASDQFIKSTLMHGREGTPMLSFSEQGLSEKDINDLVAFIRSFELNPLDLAEPKDTDLPATLVFESPYDKQTTIQNIKDAAVGNNFILIREQTLDYGFVPEDQQDHSQHIIYICNFSFLNRALAIDPRVGLFLPCRITIVEKDGQVLVYAMNPSRLAQLFNNSELNRLCGEMNTNYISIIEEATF